MTYYDDKAAAITALTQAVEAIEMALGLLPAGAYATVRARLDILEARINNPFAPAPNALNPFFIGNTGVSIQTSSGDPNFLGVLGSPGSLYLRQDGYVNQGLYSMRSDGYWHLVNPDTIVLDGYGGAGTSFNLTVPGTDNPITFPVWDNGKAYDITVRVLITLSTGSTPSGNNPFVANFVYDILAHVESGTLVLDNINTTLGVPNGTGWSVNISASTNTLVINIPTYTGSPNGAANRRAIATIEWRELSRL